MNSTYVILGVVALIFGVVVASRRSIEPRLRLAAGVLALVAIVFITFGQAWFTDSLVRRYEDASLRQGYVLGFGLGQHLKQTQSGRSLVILRSAAVSARDRETINGLKDGLEGSLNVVAEHELDTSRALDYRATALLFTQELLTELKSTGADIVVSFIGLPMRVDGEGHVDSRATTDLWRSPEYAALQWALPVPPALSPAGMFREGRVLAAVREKQHEVTAKGFPAFLEIKGTPAELCNAWFEVITADTGL